MQNGITTRGSETLDASKTVKCDFCGQHSAHERFDELKFHYGPDDVVLSAIVAVTECAICEEAYTGGDAEIQRQFAVRDHLRTMTDGPPVAANGEVYDFEAWKKAIRKDVEERFGPIPENLVPAGEAGW
jgi:hypothetical protein